MNNIRKKRKLISQVTKLLGNTLNNNMLQISTILEPPLLRKASKKKKKKKLNPRKKKKKKGPVAGTMFRICVCEQEHQMF